jgi:hypothetical protein
MSDISSKNSTKKSEQGVEIEIEIVINWASRF